MKIGVYICHCGTNISQTVDVEELARFSRTLPDVFIVRDYKYMCSDPGQELIKKDIKELGLDRIVVSSCSPLMHEITFRHAVSDAGLNQFLFQMSNIREQCSWVHEDKLRATYKAKKLVAGAISRVRYHKELEIKEVPVNPNVLVVGGGIAGIEAGLHIANAGKQVYMVEKEPSIGGHMAQFDKTFPTLDCAACILTPKMVQAGQNKNIELLSYSEVIEVNGYIGNFKVKIKKKPRFVYIEKCTACSECEKVCPVDEPSEFDLGMRDRKAIYRSFPQAVPNAYVINKTQEPSPCRIGCPAGCNSHAYTMLISKGKFKEALALIRERIPLPGVMGRVCHAPCEDRCNRSEADEPLAIRELKRFVTDLEMQGIIPSPQRGEGKGEGAKAAIVGSGPAGLTCAYDLAGLGYDVTVFEALPKPGGMLRVGIPRYRLPEEVIDYDIEMIKKTGVKIKTNARVENPKELFKQGFKAVFVATGAHKSRRLDVEGEDLEGVVHGLDFLRKPPDVKGKIVAVIGGGNTALDSVRTALRLGAREAFIVYRRSEKEMPVIQRELEEAKEEGVKFYYLMAPSRIIRGTGIECTHMKLVEELDASGRRKMVPDESKAKTIIKADIVIPAVAQIPEKGYIKVDEVTYETDTKGIFAGGDVIGKEGLAVYAIAHGHEAAVSIDRFLRGIDLIEGREKKKQEGTGLPKRRIEQKARIEMPRLEARQRIKDFSEIELGFTKEQAVAEASRCVSCSGCCECMECVKVCEPKAIEHNMQEEIKEVNVGTIILATGFDLFNAERAIQFGYPRLPNVFSSLEFERLSNATGPTQGKILLKNGKQPETVAILHCIGSRDENYNEYCSRVCCMYALKFSHLVREKVPDAKVYELYIDMRAYGKGYEEFYKRCLKEDVIFIRGKGAEVMDEKGKLVVKCEDTLLGIVRSIPVDMVVLCNALEPNREQKRLATLFGINLSRDGFFLERHPKLAPVQSLADGIFIAGTCQGPKDVPDTVAQAGLAAAGALSLIDKGKVEIEPITVSCEETVCGGCKICMSVCPYDALRFNEEKKIVEVEEAICKGCGTCASVCPSGAARQRMFMDEQIFSEIEGVLNE